LAAHTTYWLWLFESNPGDHGSNYGYGGQWAELQNPNTTEQPGWSIGSFTVQNGYRTPYVGDFSLTGSPVPANLIAMTQSGTNLVFSGINGQSGGTYYLLRSTNLMLATSQWIPVATNILNVSGNFIITATNAWNRGFAGEFFILQQK